MPPPEILRLADRPEVQRQFKEYVATRWKAWAELHQRWRTVHNVYARLFSIHQAQVKLGEELELVVGVGCLLWRTQREQTIRRHVLTARALLTFDSSRGEFQVSAPSDGAKIQIELDMLEADESPTGSERRQIEDLLGKAENDLWDRSTIEPILKSVAHSIEDTDPCKNIRRMAGAGVNLWQTVRMSRFKPRMSLDQREERRKQAVRRLAASATVRFCSITIFTADSRNSLLYAFLAIVDLLGAG